jgi:O-antigen/teichoic acid export membrane protein
MSAHLRTDGFLLERLYPSGAHEAGLYAAAYRLLDASNMAGYLIASFLMPFAARLWSEKKALQEIILQSRHLLLMFSIGIISITCMLAPWMQQVLYHRTDAYGASILQWTIAALFGYSLVQIYGTVMTATGNIIKFCWMNFGALALNITLNLLLIPQYGALGCAVAAFISQTLLGLSTLIFVHSKIHKGIEWKSAAIYILSFFVLCGLVYLMQHIGANNWGILVLVTLVTFLIMWGTKLLSVNTWLSFLKKQ